MQSCQEGCVLLSIHIKRARRGHGGEGGGSSHIEDRKGVHVRLGLCYQTHVTHQQGHATRVHVRGNVIKGGPLARGGNKGGGRRGEGVGVSGGTPPPCLLHHRLEQAPSEAPCRSAAGRAASRWRL